MNTKAVLTKFADKLGKLHAIDRECVLAEHACAALHWDMETKMPELGVQHRVEQLALLEGILHEKAVSPEIGGMLSALGSETKNPAGDESLPDIERDFLKNLRRRYDRETKLPAEFVTSFAKAEGLSRAAWAKARAENNFAAFLPHLAQMIELSKKRAVYWGWKNPYDGLLDIYEPDMGSDAITAVFTPLRAQLSALLKKIAASPAPDVSFLERNFDADAQRQFSLDLMTKLGFDFKRGRLDTSAHPFTTSLGPDDVRITTRFVPKMPLSSIFSTIHECGHAFYDGAFPAKLRGTSLANGASMGIHESQSRFWENVVGRSYEFWAAFYPLLTSHFPDALRAVQLDAFHKAVNAVQPSLIRTEADEVTYSLHIILRFELEKKLLSGELDPARLPEAWRAAMKETLGIEPESDTDGVLQDIHWSQGSFGYFPSYALGNLYGLQFYEKLRADLPDFLEKGVKDGFAALHAWLNDTIYVWGCRLEPQVLLKKVTGGTLSAEPFLRYIEKKYAALYGF